MRLPPPSVALTIALIVTIGSLIALPGGLFYGAKGTLDFIQYWSAFQIARSGGDPYDGALQHATQLAVGQAPDRTVFMWNPPWTLTLLGPVLLPPFPVSALIWLVLQGVFLFAILLLVERIIRIGRRERLAAASAIVLFYPVWDNVLWGQTGLFLGVAIAVFYGAAVSGRDRLSGAAMVPLLIKPHLFYLVFLFTAWWALRERRWKIVASALIVFTILVGATFVLFPGTIESWIGTFARSPSGPGVIPREQWVTASVGGWLRLLLRQGGEVPPVWPLAAVPAVTLIVAVCYAVCRKAVPRFERDLFPVLALSLATAPYGWLYDQSVLLFGQAILAARAMDHRIRPPLRHSVLGGLIALQAGLLGTSAASGSMQHHFVWFPPAFAILWWLVWPKLTSHSADGGGVRLKGSLQPVGPNSF